MKTRNKCACQLKTLCGRSFTVILLTILLTGCAEKGGKFKAPAPTLESSMAYCVLGRCSRTPVVMTVFHKFDSMKSFEFRSWIMYDGRIRAHSDKFITVLDKDAKPVCMGAYRWSGFGRTSDVKLTCFRWQSVGVGKFRTEGRQTEGIFAGKGTGTGLIATKEELIAFVYGVTLEESNTAEFRDLWRKYGGPRDSLPDQTPKKTDSVAPLGKDFEI